MSTPTNENQFNSSKFTKNVVLVATSITIVAFCLFGYFGLNKSNFKSNSKEETSQNANLKFEKMTESDIKTSNSKVNVYVFWGDGCSHCKRLAEFFTSKKAELKDKINLYTFEVWSDSANAKFMKDFGKSIGENPRGVPFYIIGKRAFSGFSESEEQNILDAIESEFQKSKKTDQYIEYKSKQ